MDIVERLRALSGVVFVHEGQGGIEDAGIAHKAAAEIERLRAELQRRDAAETLAAIDGELHAGTQKTV